ncbi:MAG: sigma-54-dependent Fis family transcriptional regulator [Calditrichaeota bacterium]|nr:sigma-54-dependent Fis family transcriptional regulator [Calditrichota bacterium]
MNTKEIQQLQEKLGILGRTQEIYEVIETIQIAAPTNISVLINGESGSGKEVIAQSIHQLSERKHQSFVAINCGALPEGLIDSELFGYEKGAFTGAVAQKKGLFEVADHGTIFLDELGEMPLKTQVRLLRVLESGEVIRVGGTEAIKVDVRIIAATHRNLQDLIEHNEFRRDLYYRLKAIQINIPPLRDRKDDIELLMDHFIKRFILSNHVIYGGIDDDAKHALLNYKWPGNIRELKNTLETLLVLAKGQRITMHMIEQQLPEINQEPRFETPNWNLPISVNKSSDQVERELIYQTLLSLKMELSDIKTMLSQIFRPLANVTLPQSSSFNSMNTQQSDDDYYQSNSNKIETLSMNEMEKETIRKALERYEGNRRKASQALNISERTLYRKIKEYELQ